MIYSTACDQIIMLLQALKEQFPVEEGFKITHFECFKFKGTELHIKVVPCCEQDHCVIALEPTVAKVISVPYACSNAGVTPNPIHSENKNGAGGETID